MPQELSAVAVLLLALLQEGPRHPYQLYQALVARGDDRLVRVNPGAVYHGVEKLEREGYVRAVGTDREGRRPERTTYEITDAGSSAFERRLRSLLGDEHHVYPLFPVGLAEAADLPLDDVVHELRRRRNRLDDACTLLRARYEGARENGIPRRYMLDVEHEIALQTAEVAWLDATITDLVAGSLDWGQPFPVDAVAARAAARAAQGDPTAIRYLQHRDED